MTGHPHEDDAVYQEVHSGTPPNGNRVFRDLFFLAVGIILPMIGFYVAEFHKTVTREEVVAIVTEASPYTKDKSVIWERLDMLSANQTRVLHDLEEMKQSQARLETAMGIGQRKRP